MYRLKFASLLLSLLLFFTFNPFCLAANIYLGGSVGLSKRFISEKNLALFPEESFETELKFPFFKSFNGKIGYNFYPNMAIELFGTFQPEHKSILMKLPATIAAPDTDKSKKLPARSFDINSQSQMLIVNLLYQLAPVESKTRPYFSMGIGINRLNLSTIKPKLQFEQNGQLTTSDQNLFEIEKTQTYYSTTQFSLGLTRQLVNNLAFDLAFRTYLTKKVEFAANIYDFNQQKLVPLQEAALLSKASLLIINELTIGLTYKF